VIKSLNPEITGIQRFLFGFLSTIKPQKREMTQWLLLRFTLIRLVLGTCKAFLGIGRFPSIE
jgi:hypothetical protein